MLLSTKQNAVLTRITGWITFLTSILILNISTFSFIDNIEHVDQVDVLACLLLTIALIASIFYTATTLFSSPWKEIHKAALTPKDSNKN